jgi:hypothetical protein
MKTNPPTREEINARRIELSGWNYFGSLRSPVCKYGFCFSLSVSRPRRRASRRWRNFLEAG